MTAKQQWMIQEIERLNVEVKRQDKAIIDKLYEVGKLKQQNAALVEALEDNMNWIGPPPVDKYSYDSLREDAWAKGKAALALVEGDKDGSS